MVQNQNVKLSSKLIDFIFCVQTIYSLWIQLKFNPTRLQECLKNPYTHILRDYPLFLGFGK